MSHIPPYEIHQFIRENGRGAFSSQNKNLTKKNKEYPRFETIQLQQPDTISTPLSDALAHRESAAKLENLKLPSLQIISNLLGNTLSAHADGRRRAPSGGGLYPIEAYVIAPLHDADTLETFHYRPDIHALETLWSCQRSDVDGAIKLKENKGAPLYIVLTAVWERTEVQYGDFSYMLALIEVGNVSQNILLASSALGLDACPIAGFYDRKVLELLDLDPHAEQPILFVGLGQK